MDGFTTNRYWARLNCGTTSTDSRFYCVLPDELTKSQWYVIEEYLKLGEEKNRNNILIFVIDERGVIARKTYYFDDHNADEIFKLMKRYYLSGTFYESKNK